MTKKLEENLAPYHVVGNNLWPSQDLALALNMSQGFSLAAEGAIGRVLLAPLVEESPTGKLEAYQLHVCVCLLLQDLVQSCMSLFLSFSGNDESDRHSIRRSLLL